MNMYFAVNKAAQDIVDSLIHAFEKVTKNNRELNFYALIDASFEIARPQKKPSIWKNNAVSIYKDTELEGLSEAAPYLLQIEHSDASVKKQLGDLIKMTTGMPMVSFIASPHSIDEISESFHFFSEVSTEDDQKFLLRFADTRVLPVLDSILRKEGIGSWRKAITHWWIINRAGQLFSLPETAFDKQHQEQKDKHLKLSQKSFDALINAGEVDAIIDVISDQNPDLLNDKLPSNVFDLVADLFGVMQNFKIENFPDMAMFCTTAIATSKQFYDHPKFNELFESKMWIPGKLGEAMMAIDDQYWAEI